MWSRKTGEPFRRSLHRYDDRVYQQLKASLLPATMRRALYLIPIALFLIDIFWCSGLFEPYETWNERGPIQVVAGPDEAWCFVEIDRVVHRPGMFVEPTNITMGHRQEVVILTASGVKQRIPVTGYRGVTFSPNISYIFHLRGDFYLYQGASGSTHRSVYRWQKDHFELLPLEESEALVVAEQLGKFDSAPIEQMPDSGEWRCVFHDRGWNPDTKPFIWNDQSYEIASEPHEPLVQVVVRRLSEPPWDAELTEYDPTRRPLSGAEHSALWTEPRQEGHPRSMSDRVP